MVLLSCQWNRYWTACNLFRWCRLAQIWWWTWPVYFRTPRCLRIQSSLIQTGTWQATSLWRSREPYLSLWVSLISLPHPLLPLLPPSLSPFSPLSSPLHPLPLPFIPSAHCCSLPHSLSDFIISYRKKDLSGREPGQDGDVDVLRDVHAELWYQVSRWLR